MNEGEREFGLTERENVSGSRTICKLAASKAVATDGALYSLWLQSLVRAGDVDTHGTHLGRVVNHVAVSALDGTSGERLDVFGGETGRVVPFQGLALRAGSGACWGCSGNLVWW
jgi:hypothetical protein